MRRCNKEYTKGIKILSQDEIKLKEKKASESLVELYSKNMLFYQAIASKVRNSEMEKQFIATHPDSLEKFMEPLISKAKIQKYILFTFSRNIELIEAIQRVEIKLNSKKTVERKVTIKSFSAEDFSKKSEEGPKSRLEGSKTLIENSVKVNTFTIIKFTDREMWRQMDKLREEVDKIAIPSQHFLFFIGMYSLEKDSLLEVQDRNSPITFSVADWKMVVIDNVYESNYPRFMKMMRNKDSQGAPMIPKQILMEDCSKHRNSRMVQLIQGEIKQKLIQCGINPREILALLKEKTSETIFSFIADRVISMNNDKLEDRPITELVRHSEYKELLLKNTDIDDVISDIMEKIFFPRIKIAIEVIHRKKGFTFLNSIYNSGELSHTVKKKLLEYWIDDVKSLSPEDFKQNLTKNSLEAPSMIKVFRDVIDNNSKDFTDIYEEVSREKEREITFAAIRNKFESSNQEDQEEEEHSDQEEVSSCRGVLFDMFEQYIQKIQVYLQYQAGKLEYDRDISIYTGVMLLENHCRNRHARWEPITKSVMYKLGTEYCRIFIDVKETQTIPTANIVHAIFAFRYIFDKELEYLEANPNQIDGAIQGFHDTMFLSINRRKMEVSVRPFLNQSELDHNIDTLRVDLETMRLWKDGSKSLPKYTVELLLSIYETIIGMDYRSSDVLKAFMPIHNQELKRGTQSSKLIKIAHQFFKVLSRK
jgi:hypothetical protein